jgi:DNA-binding SARP family transcriptional activator
MPFIAKSAAPGEPSPAAAHWAFDQAAAGGMTLFTAPPGYLLTEGLFEALQRRGRQVLWVRLGPEDRDPGTFLLSMVAAARRHHPGFGASTLELMRRQPGPVAGWLPHFGRLGAELAEVICESGAFVLEHVHHLGRVHPTLTMLGSELLRAISSDAATVIISHEDLPPAALRVRTTHRPTRDLRLAPAAAGELLARDAPGLSRDASRRAATLCRGEIAGLVALSDACAMLGSAVVERAIRRARRAQELLSLLARAWLQTIGRDGRRALGLTLQLEYTHRALTEAVLGGPLPPPGPWLQPLADGWSRIRTVWHEPLRAVLGSNRLVAPETVHRAADYLLGRGATERAIPLYLQLRDAACAARVLANEADRLVDLGQWDTLGEWLAALPADILRVEPRLLYNQAEIAAASGHGDAAQRGFTAAASGFAACADPDGACRSMLAESALAAARRDLGRAQARAQAASALAVAAGLDHQQVWAHWQLGCVAIAAEELDSASVHFGRAATIASRLGERPETELVFKAERLTDRLQELRREQAQHRDAWVALQRAEQETTARILEHLGDAAGRVHDLLGAYGWTHTPLALKAPALQASPALTSPAPTERWWCRLRRPLAALGPAARSPGVHPAGEPAPSVPVAPAGEDVTGTASAVPVLTVHLLGQLRLTLSDTPVDDLPSGRGRSLFNYLVTHRDPWPQREVLMEVFWPDAPPKAARNSLNVAVHGLRRALRSVGSDPVIVLEGGAYRLAANFRLWVDVDEFERHLGGGRRLETAGEPTAAIAEYELAASLYQGDFLADDPYEEWPVLTRERLRPAYLDVLDRLSLLYFGQGRYAACAALCQRIIERDACREDAHRRLIRCYSRQGQPYLALRQYHACAEALRTELSVDPAPATVRLHEAIRGHQAV